MPCTIWYHLHNLKNVKNTHERVLTLLLKVIFLHGCFTCFLNCTNVTKSRKASQIEGQLLHLIVPIVCVRENNGSCTDGSIRNASESMVIIHQNGHTFTTFLEKRFLKRYLPLQPCTLELFSFFFFTESLLSSHIFKKEACTSNDHQERSR